MGGSSSKEKRSRSQSQTKKSLKKVKERSRAKHSNAQWSRADGVGGDVTFVRGRPRSSEGDSEEVTQPPPQRGRSKSLRFGDFTQLGRIHKVGDTDLLPVDIAFFQEGKVAPEELCHVCSVYTGSETLVCGVCYRCYHQGCLAKIGQWNGPPGPPDILTCSAAMWTCHQCSNLGHLLTDEEIIEILKRLKTCGIRREDDMTVTDYLAFCHMSLQEDEGKVLTRDKADNARRRFTQVEPEAGGRITWCQFLNIETVRFLNKRNKNALVRLLKPPEIERARDAFRLLDTDMDGRITKAMAHDALDRNSRKSGYYPDETMMYIDDDMDQTISWMEFLRDRAIYIIAERPCLRPSPLAHSTARRGSNRSSLAGPSSLPVMALDQSPPIPHSKALVRKHSANAKSVPSTPVSKLNAFGPVYRHSDGASASVYSSNPYTASPPHGSDHSFGQQGSPNKSVPVTPTKSVPVTPTKSVPVTPTKKPAAGFPLLPPPPSSHHVRRSSGSSSAAALSSLAKKTEPDFLQQGSQHAGLRSTFSDSGAFHYSPGHPGGAGSQSQASGADSGFRLHSENTESRRQGAGDNAVYSSSATAVLGKPPTPAVYGRAVAAPAYGKLVERVQKGDYRRTQVRSMYLASDSSQAAATPSLSIASGESSTGQRPLSFV